MIGATSAALSLACFLRASKEATRAFAVRSPRGLGMRIISQLGNHLGLMLGVGCQDMDGEPVRLREIVGRELDARLHQPETKRTLRASRSSWAMMEAPRTLADSPLN
jgi:hypothetical protein